jgi:hypothetical protein
MLAPAVSYQIVVLNTSISLSRRCRHSHSAPKTPVPLAPEETSEPPWRPKRQPYLAQLSYGTSTTGVSAGGLYQEP